MATKQEIIAAIRNGEERVDRTFIPLSAGQLETRVHPGPDGWMAKEILAHLAGRAAGYDRIITMAERGQALTGGGFNVDEWNRQRIDERIARSGAELLAEFHAVHEALIRRVEEMPDDLLQTPIPRPQGTMALGDVLLASGGRHSASHADEVEHALASRANSHALPDRFGLRSPFAALHHVALITNDMKKTVAFYRDVLGSEVAMGHRLSRPGQERHYFITVAPNTVFAFFEFPDAELPTYKDATLPTTGRALDHIAFFAESDEAFVAWHKRLTDVGVDHLSPIREMGPGTRAFFFADPNGIVLEVMAPMGDAMSFPTLTDPDPAY